MKDNFLTSQKALDAITKMRAQECTLQELELTEEEIQKLMDAMGTIQHNEKRKTYYIVKYNTNNYEIISETSKDAKEEKWVEISDVYLGSQFCDIETLEYILKTAKEEGYTYIHIAGDLCAGHPKFKNQATYLKEKTAQEQADLAIKIFSKFPDFKYYCINGERDLSFEKTEINPLVLIKAGLEEKGIEFHHINETVANLVIDGVVKRLQHGNGKMAYTKSYKIERQIWEQFENMSDNVIIDNINYNIAFMQFGHYHVNSLQISGGIYITSTSGMIFDDKGILKENTTYPSAKFTNVVIKNKKVIKFTTENIMNPKKVIM